MLKLHRLDISGFKSFVDPVSVEFADGITAIVGPNGCGKSNLSEAVTWGLGEQSIKYLRGGKMEDVIFNGAERRRALGMAEVTLTLQTDPGFEGAEEGEIAIGRRVFRGGEGQYRLNGKVVPLKKIKDLLMDTGLGIRAYSVIGQGQVEAVLSGKPQERRKLLEEAAGITRYKARKRVAELKLEDALGNLLRLEDVVAELERSLRSLKRQANAARRYKEREREHHEILRTLLAMRLAAADERLRELRRTLTGSTDRESALSADLHRREAELAIGREEVETLAQRVAERHSRLTGLAATIEGRQEFTKGGRRSLEDLGERLDRGTKLNSKYREELQVQATVLAELDERHSTLTSEHGEAASAVAADRDQIEDARRGLETTEAELETLRSELLSSGSKITSLQSRLHREQIETEKNTYRRDHTNAELERLADERRGTGETLSAAEEAVASIVGELEAETAEHESTSHALVETLANERSVNEESVARREELASLEQRQTILEQLEAEDAERRARFAEIWDDLGLGQPRFLADELTVPEGWEECLDLYLEPLRDAVLLPAGEDAYEIAHLIQSQGVGGALLQASDEGATGTGPGDARPLGEALGLPAEYRGSLPAAFLVDDDQRAATHSLDRPETAFLSRTGTWTEGRVVRVSGRTRHPGALQRRSDLRELSERIPTIRTGLEELAARLDRLVGRRTREAEAKNALEVSMGELRQRHAAATRNVDESRERVRSLELRRKELEQDRQATVGELGRIDEQRTEFIAQLEEARICHGELETKFDTANEALEAAREHRELLSTAGAGRQGRLYLLEERLEVHDQERNRLHDRRRELERLTEQWQAEETAIEERRQGLRDELERASQELQHALVERDDGESAAREDQEALDARRSASKELETEVGELREQREAELQKIQDQRVSEATLEQEIAHLEESYREETGEEPGPDAASRGDDESEAESAPPSIEELEERLETTRAVLERLGPVNLLAAQEYDEQHERHGFLVEQRADIEGSVERLRTTIREINRTSGERFRATFEEVNRNFGEVFVNLFRGGEAEMRLLDEEDVLESGIEIVARPPGKKLQNIMLLSGGEKSLTAIALLFALFRTKPSPFCILDEVDAALDDSNILRFVELLRSYSGEIQFLIISHNKLTMEAASTLYGVTMEEKGVSKIVGVELDHMHPAQALATA